MASGGIVREWVTREVRSAESEVRVPTADEMVLVEREPWDRVLDGQIGDHPLYLTISGVDTSHLAHLTFGPSGRVGVPNRSAT